MNLAAVTKRGWKRGNDATKKGPIGYGNPIGPSNRENMRVPRWDYWVAIPRRHALSFTVRPCDGSKLRAQLTQTCSPRLRDSKHLQACVACWAKPAERNSLHPLGVRCSTNRATSEILGRNFRKTVKSCTRCPGRESASLWLVCKDYKHVPRGNRRSTKSEEGLFRQPRGRDRLPFEIRRPTFVIRDSVVLAYFVLLHLPPVTARRLAGLSRLVVIAANTGPVLSNSLSSACQSSTNARLSSEKLRTLELTMKSRQ